MQHIMFEVHAYVIALSKTVLDYESLCSTLCLNCMLMLLLCQRLHVLDYAKVQGNAWLIIPSSAYAPNSGGDAAWKGLK